MTVNDFFRFFCFPDLVQHQRGTVDDPRIIHHLPQSEHPLMLQRCNQIGSVHYGSAVFEGGCRNTGRDHEKGLQSDVFWGIEHVGKPVKPADVANFVRIGDDCRRPAGNDKVAELCRRCMTGLYMDMAVDQAGNQIASPGIHHQAGPSLPRLGIPGKISFAYQHIRFKPLFIIHIQDTGIGNAELGFFS